ncbi:MAG: polysaccharide lyase [Anditalea sp.]
MKIITNVPLSILVILLFIGITVTSCQLVDIDETAMENPTPVNSTGILTSFNLIYEETFEGSDPFYAYVKKQLASEHAFTVSSSESLRGKKSGRFELRRDDPKATDNGKRSEIYFPEIAHKNRWYAFGLFLPADGYARDRNKDILSQWHQLGVTSAPMSLRVQNDRFLLMMKINSATTTQTIDLGPATKDKWHEFTFHVVHSRGKDGVIEIWHNGEKTVTRNGANLSDGPLPRWKLGIYKPTWATSTKTDTELRVMYFDNIRMGNENAIYGDMVPSVENIQGWGLDVAEIESLTLINGLTNKAVNTIVEGGTINRRLLQTKRVSIRAEIMKGFGGSIQFDLKGPKDNSYIDNKAPFALFGDDSKGKYYHSGGLPLGDYTLTVTPYAEQKAKGKAASSKIIRFKVVD